MARSSFNSFVETSTLKTTENSEVLLSAKSFVLDNKSFVKSLIYLKNRSGPKIDPWGTPALISARKENWPLKILFAFCFSESVLLNWGVYLKYHFYFNLKIRPTCQTFSKALEISNKTPQTYYLWVIAVSCFNAGFSRFNAWLISSN